MTLILGIETSCDETAASVVEDGTLVRSHIVASQNALHERYGGVVPEIASRAHLESISPVIQESLAKAGVAFGDLDAIAVGNRPGLIGSLLVGVSAAKALAWSLDKPLIGVDHIRAHLYAAFLRTDATAEVQLPGAFPAVGLVVSGGHSNLYAMTSPLAVEQIGRTIDDAVGEAYDKAAVILDAGYPGGPMLDKLAQTGDPKAHDFPRSLMDRDTLEFSFSGLKTAMLYAVRGHPRGRGKEATFERSAADLTDKQKRDLAASFQEAAVDTLIRRLGQAAERTRSAQSIVIGGGVSANSLLRSRVMELGKTLGIAVHVPKMTFCLDNAAMIAGLAHHQLAAGQVDDLTLPAVSTTG